MCVPQSAPMLLTRNLLYTGITRAKKLLIVISNKNIIEFMIQNTDIKKRNTGLIQKTENLNLKLQDYENTKEKELIKYIKEIVSFENIDRNIILNLIDSIEIMDKNNIKINYKFAV